MFYLQKERVPDMHVYRKIKIFASKISLRVTLKITAMATANP
jgi:hypothetical protein